MSRATKFARRRGLAVAGIAAVVIAALVVSPAIGGPSLKKLVKKEVSKQLKNKTGPQGAQGAPGAPGTAKGYGHWFGGTQVQDVPNSSNVEIAAAGPSGEYCINAVGFTPESISVTIDQTGQTLLENRTADAGLGGYGGCSTILPGTDAFVRTHLTNDNFVSAGFFVVLN